MNKLNITIWHILLPSNNTNHFFFFGTCFDFVSQNGICRAAAVELNFRPQNLHCTKSFSGPEFIACCYYWLSWTPFPCFKPARKAKLWAFHLGIFYYFEACFTGCLAGGFLLGTSGGLLNPSTSGARWAEESNAFLLDWNTFWQIFSCLEIAWLLNILPQPWVHWISSPGS